MNAADRTRGPTAHADERDATQTSPTPTARPVGNSDGPLYELQDRRYSGEWRTLETFTDPLAANQAKALLQAAGADVRVELIPTPIIP